MTLIRHQLSGMIRYELLRHWRRRALPITMLLWLITIIVANHFFKDVNTVIPPELLVSDVVRHFKQTINVTYATAYVSTIYSIIALSVLVAEIIPIDRQQGIFEWQKALPLRPAIYLLGKLLGLWAVIFVSLVSIAVISALITAVMNGSFALSVYIKLWLHGLFPLTFYMSALTMLLASVFSSRRWAMLCGITLAVIMYIGMMPGLLDLVNNTVSPYFEQNFEAYKQAICAVSQETCLYITPELFSSPSLKGEFKQTLVTGTRLTALAGLTAWVHLVLQERR